MTFLLGPEIVQRLLPHRPPLLLVDAVTQFAVDPPSLTATKHIAATEAVFAGHFPGRAIWPGAYTIEGLAQACALVGGLSQHPPGAPFAAPSGVGLLVGVDVKLTEPVWPGDTLAYSVRRTHVVDSLHRFDVEATVGARRVARGTLTLAWRPAP
jgi:3-hydroxyacyl-[acyl-carrier-protein] dehydratase